jgi:hypothetical protein
MSQTAEPTALQSLTEPELEQLRFALTNVRDEVAGSPYIAEALRVLPVQGYRSAIGSYWNAVIDDLRNKILHRSLELFNREAKKSVKAYEDFQRDVNDYELIEGAHKIGVLGWEAHKMLHQARETRNVFDGHPKSSTPDLVKVLNFISDCNKYVLSQDFPPAFINIDDYLANLDSSNYHQNGVVVDQAMSDLPDNYRRELANRMYRAHVHPNSSAQLRGNIEFVMPILWRILPKEERAQLGRQLDREFANGDAQRCLYGTELFVRLEALRYVSEPTRQAIFEKPIEHLENNLDTWAEEERAVTYLERLGTSVPPPLIPRYVSAMTLTYVGYKSGTAYYARSDFYSNGAAVIIPRIFEKFDDALSEAFTGAARASTTLKSRIRYPGQLNRLRSLGQILLNRQSLRTDLRTWIEILVDPTKENVFFSSINA